jgi:ubiquitin-activating enzyme E1
MALNNSSTNTVDEGLYSRQLYALGPDAHNVMKKLSETHVLIQGMGGLGNEIAKNIILSGVKHVTIHDTELVTNKDLSSLYYARSLDLGSNRATTCYSKLKELNPYVSLTVNTDKLTWEFMSQFSVIVLTNSLLDEQIRINNFCCDKKIKFINCCSMGLFGMVFCDFGSKFLVTDTDGEELLVSIVDNVVDNIVTCIESRPHKFTSGDFVKFSKLELNMDIEPIEIEWVSSISFRLKCDMSIFGSNINMLVGTEVSQVKMPKIIDFLPLYQSVKKPEFVITNYVDFDRPSDLHAIYVAFNKYVKTHKKMPNSSDLSEDLSEISHKKSLIEKFTHCINGNLSPIVSIIGGIVAQEIIKASSGKYHPINQWLYFDAFDCLPENYKELDTTSTNNPYKTNRYDGQVSVFGHEFQTKLTELHYFIVGSGAIGCELLKNFAMMGVGCSDRGKIIITDMDTIEKSNLNRQFLFRDKDITHPKSTTAAQAIKMMNPFVNIDAHLNRVGLESESVYNKEFMLSLNGVANALDNVQARKYMDSQCVAYGKSLLESGTLGTKGNVQVVKPFQTESYGSTEDPVEQSIPVCTIKNFPNQIEHTIQHARDIFQGRFFDAPSNLMKYIKNPDINDLTPSDRVALIDSIKSIIDHIPKSFEDCIKYAYTMWHDDYYVNIKQLLHQFPPDCVTESNIPFWSSGKKCPVVINFDLQNPLHYDYIVHTSTLWANIFGITQNKSIDQNYINSILHTINLPEVNFDKVEKISVTDEEEKEKEKEKEKDIKKDDSDIIATFPPMSYLTTLSIYPQEFEKDDDSNHHIDFITAASNMRATIYQIQTVNKHMTKGIAGKIIPALATTTSVVAGLVSLELYKLVWGFDNLEKYSNAFINLAIPMFAFSEPRKPPCQIYKDYKFTLWDNFIIEEDLTLQELLTYFEIKGLLLDFVGYESFMIYTSFLSDDKLMNRINKKIKDILDESGVKVNSNTIILTIGVEPEEDKDGNEIEVELPNVKIYLN